MANERSEPSELTTERDPATYQCAECHTNGVKLWRMGSSSHVLLQCYLCVCKKEGVDPTSVDVDGTVPSRMGHGRSDQIGYHVPAVPHPTGGYWQYAAVDTDGAAWWRAMPLAH